MNAGLDGIGEGLGHRGNGKVEGGVENAEPSTSTCLLCFDVDIHAASYSS